jgi:hypothetical protein
MNLNQRCVIASLFLDQLPKALPKISTLPNYITNYIYWLKNNYYSVNNYITNYLRQNATSTKK